MIYFVIMDTIHIIESLLIINIAEFAFKCMFASLFVTVIKTQYIYIIHIFFIYANINIFMILRFTYLTLLYVDIFLQDIIYCIIYHIIYFLVFPVFISSCTIMHTFFKRNYYNITCTKVVQKIVLLLELVIYMDRMGQF